MLIRVRAGIALFALLVAAACGSPSPESSSAPAATPAAAPTAPPAAPAPLPGESTIRGTVKYEGTAEKPRVVRMDSDPLCMPEGPQTSEVLVVGPGNGLQNAFVYVKDGLGGEHKFTAPQTPVVLDQKGCKYSPHVFGVQVGQPVIILNSDPTLHNVHAVPKANAEFNFGQAVKGMKTTRMFDKPEVMVPFRCDVHGWMAAYGGVSRIRTSPSATPTARSRSKGCRPAPTRSRSGTSGSARRRRRSRWTERAPRRRTSLSRDDG